MVRVLLPVIRGRRMSDRAIASTCQESKNLSAIVQENMNKMTREAFEGILPKDIWTTSFRSSLKCWTAWFPTCWLDCIRKKGDIQYAFVNKLQLSCLLVSYFEQWLWQMKTTCMISVLREHLPSLEKVDIEELVKLNRKCNCSLKLSHELCG